MHADRQTQTKRRGSKPQHRARNGVATLWVLLAVPALAIMLVFVTDIANIWVARIEATHAMEAAALASVKQWKNGGNNSANRTASRRTAVNYAGANTMLGLPVIITPNENKISGGPNENASTTGNVVLGELRQMAGQRIFDAATSPTTSGNFGVRTQTTIPVQSVWSDFGGFAFGPYSVSVEAVALFRTGGSPQLVRVDIYLP